MQALWRGGAGSVAAVQVALKQAGRPLATTTIATLLQRLEKQGWVKHSREGRQFIYHPRTPEHEVARNALQRVVDAFFGGSVASVAAELLQSDDVTHEELERVRRLLDETERKA